MYSTSTTSRGINCMNIRLLREDTVLEQRKLAVLGETTEQGKLRGLSYLGEKKPHHCSLATHSPELFPLYKSKLAQLESKKLHRGDTMQQVRENLRKLNVWAGSSTKMEVLF